MDSADQTSACKQKIISQFVSYFKQKWKLGFSTQYKWAQKIWILK